MGDPVSTIEEYETAACRSRGEFMTSFLLGVVWFVCFFHLLCHPNFLPVHFSRARMINLWDLRFHDWLTNGIPFTRIFVVVILQRSQLGSKIVQFAFLVHSAYRIAYDRE